MVPVGTAGGVEAGAPGATNPPPEGAVDSPEGKYAPPPKPSDLGCTAASILLLLEKTRVRST
eukprot:4607119-Prymnesium_polylepis.1